MTLATQPDRRWTIKTESLLRGTLGLMLAMSCVSFIEPSPYELFFFLLIPVAVLSGLVITRTNLVLIFIIGVAICAEVAALMPYIDHRPTDDGMTPAVYTVYSVYLWSSAILFALVFSRNSYGRVAVCLNAYAFSCVFAGVWGILSYLNVAGIGDHEPVTGRIAGPFKDPNVMGSYCVLGALYLMQSAILGPARYRIFNLAGLLIAAFGGVFLSFSRGSWGAMILATIFLGVSTYVTADNGAMRRKIIVSVVGLFVLIVAAGVFIVSNDTLRDTVTQRAQLEQEYDGGVTGRFGNQKRSIPMLMERPLGFGPHRFAILFNLDPHNSYIGAFASGGWAGGFAFLFLVITSSFIALRLAFVSSPFLRQAQVISPALLVLFLQALQIDIDHWRFAFLMLGALWGMESARVQAKAAELVRVRSDRAPPAPA